MKGSIYVPIYEGEGRRRTRRIYVPVSEDGRKASPLSYNCGENKERNKYVLQAKVAPQGQQLKPWIWSNTVIMIWRDVLRGGEGERRKMGRGKRKLKEKKKG